MAKKLDNQVSKQQETIRQAIGRLANNEVAGIIF